MPTQLKLTPSAAQPTLRCAHFCFICRFLFHDRKGPGSWASGRPRHGFESRIRLVFGRFWEHTPDSHAAFRIGADELALDGWDMQCMRASGLLAM